MPSTIADVRAAALTTRILKAYGVDESPPPVRLFDSQQRTDDIPLVGDIMSARHRQWLVEDVVSPKAGGACDLPASGLSG